MGGGGHVGLGGDDVGHVGRWQGLGRKGSVVQLATLKYHEMKRPKKVYINELYCYHIFTKLGKDTIENIM